MPIARLCTLLLAGTVLLLSFAGEARVGEAASWRGLTGRKAPDLTFTETAQGIESGTRLASFRGKKVVLLAFWLRDCQHCKRELPRVQSLHERWHRSGLQVISIVHDRYPLAKVLPVMKERGWSFPVVRDAGGKLAQRYGGGRRPGFYTIGIDGRVKGSIGLSERTVLTELARWRLAELERDGRMPEALAGARAQVKAGAYGAALRLAEAEARKAGASADVRVTDAVFHVRIGEARDEVPLQLERLARDHVDFVVGDGGRLPSPIGRPATPSRIIRRNPARVSAMRGGEVALERSQRASTA